MYISRLRNFALQCINTQAQQTFTTNKPNGASSKRRIIRLAPLIDSNPNPNVLPQPQVFVQYWADSPHPAPVIVSISYITDNGEWVVFPVVQNELEQPSVRMITDNIGAQFAPRRIMMIN